MFKERSLGFWILSMVILVIVGWVFFGLMISIIWGQVVPQVFSSAVDQKLLPSSLTIVQAIKLSFLFCVLGATGAALARKNTKDWSNCSKSFSKIILVVFIAVVSGLLIPVLWKWIIPDIFSGAVAHSLIPDYLSFWHSIEIIFLYTVLGISNHISQINIFDE